MENLIEIWDSIKTQAESEGFPQNKASSTALFYLTVRTDFLGVVLAN